MRTYASKFKHIRNFGTFGGRGDSFDADSEEIEPSKGDNVCWAELCSTCMIKRATRAVSMEAMKQDFILADEKVAMDKVETVEKELIFCVIFEENNSSFIVEFSTNRNNIRHILRIPDGGANLFLSISEKNEAEKTIRTETKIKYWQVFLEIRDKIQRIQQMGSFRIWILHFGFGVGMFERTNSCCRRWFLFV